jgi:hypothetical protein
VLVLELGARLARLLGDGLSAPILLEAIDLYAWCCRRSSSWRCRAS